MARYGKKKSGPTPRNYGTEEKYLRVRWVSDMYDRYMSYWSPEIERYRRNARFSWGLDFGQWPSYVVEKLREQGRRPPTYNVAGWKVETLIGSFIANGFDMKFQPSVGKLDSLTIKLQGMHLSDKGNFDYDASERVALRDCFATGVGFERMYIDDRYHEFGNIAYEAVDPLQTLLSPSWRSTHAYDIENYITWGMYTPLEIANKYGKITSDKLRELREREESEAFDYGEYQGAVPVYTDSEEKWGDRHKLIEFHWLKKEEYETEYDLKNKCNFPETGFTRGSDEDRAIKEAYIEMMGLDRNSDITWVHVKKRVKMYEAIAPTIDREMLIAPGKDRIQTNNINLYPLGRKFRRQFKGITDELYDINLAINRGEMTADDIGMRTAKGAFLLDRALTGGDDAKAAEIEAQWNDPAARIWVEEGVTQDLPGGGIIPLPHSPIPADFSRQTDRRYDLADKFSLVPASHDAQSAGPGTSGKLFQSEYQAGLIGQRPYMEIYKSYKREKTEAYPVQAKITYAGMPREFGDVKGGETYEINRPGRDQNGNRVMLDDISKLPLMKVNVFPSRMGPDLRTELRTQNLEQMELFVDPADRLLKLIMLGGISETMQNTDEEKEEMEQALFLLKQEAALTTGLNVLGLKMQMDALQAQMQQQEAKKQQAAAGGGAPGGAPGGPGGGPSAGGSPGDMGGGAPQQQLTMEGGMPGPEEAAVGTPQEDFVKMQ